MPFPTSDVFVFFAPRGQRVSCWWWRCDPIRRKSTTAAKREVGCFVSGRKRSLGSNEKWGDEFWVKTRVQTNGRENQQGVGEWSWHVFKANWLSQSGCYYKKLCQLYFFCPGEVTLQDWLRDFTSLCVLPLWCWKVENVGRKQMFHCIYMIRLCTFYLIKKTWVSHFFPCIPNHICSYSIE